MRLEKILKREDGSRVKINVDIDLYHHIAVYAVTTESCAKGKRKWRSPIDENDYLFRGLSMVMREEKRQEAYLSLVSKEEIYQARLELWENFKPNKA